ncbi:unnamed protein product [Brassica rapa subsp. narinosa]
MKLLLQQSTPDSFHWVVQAKDCKGFSSSKTWEAVRPQAEEKVWAKSVWFSGAIPRQAFIMWQANLNRLLTKVRLASWGLNIQTACCFCSNHGESRDHLFLNCTYTMVLWNWIFERLDPHCTAFLTWEELLSWL